MCAMLSKLSLLCWAPTCALSMIMDQNVLSYNKPTNSLLDEFVDNGVFSSKDITVEIEHNWSFLEANVDNSKIRHRLNQVLGEDSLNSETLSPLSSSSFSDFSQYNIVSRNKLDGYSLRVSKEDIGTKDYGSDPLSLGVDTVKQTTGYFDIEDEDKHLFFWFFESRNDPQNDPVILWLNGGPGCSSMTGLFFELGSSTINNVTLTPVNNPWSWNSNASVIFLEQPVGVGYSYSKSSKVSSTEQAGKDVYAFLQLFFTYFKDFASHDFHIAGESYAGHYIPAIANEIVAHEKESVFNLTSVMIGNGITDPLLQYYQYIPMACNATASGYKQLVSDEGCKTMEKIYDRCKPLIESCYRSQSVLSCLPATLYCEKIMDPFAETGLNYYDIRIPCIGDGCYPEMAPIDEYLNQPEVLKALGSQVDSYVGCDDTVFRNFLFTGDEMKPSQQHIAKLLDSNVHVLIYAGDKDYICNWLGNKEWINKLEWNQAESFKVASTEDWYSAFSGQHAGTVKSNGLLTFLRVFDAGHMVPHDQPEHSLDMVNRWIHGDYLFQS